MSAGKKFRDALAANQPLQIVGTINAYAAMMAKRIGHQAIYLSGGGVANASYGLRKTFSPTLLRPSLALPTSTPDLKTLAK